MFYSELVSLDWFFVVLFFIMRIFFFLDSKINLWILLVDLGVKYWLDGLKVKEL